MFLPLPVISTLLLLLSCMSDMWTHQVAAPGGVVYRVAGPGEALGSAAALELVEVSAEVGFLGFGQDKYNSGS